MKQKIVSWLEEAFSFPVFLQGSMSQEEEYPQSFFTFWNFMSENKYYDNIPTGKIYGFWIYFYSDDPETMERVTKEAEQLFRSHGVIIGESWTDTKSDTETHQGEMMEIFIMESIGG